MVVAVILVVAAIALPSIQNILQKGAQAQVNKEKLKVYEATTTPQNVKYELVFDQNGLEVYRFPWKNAGGTYEWVYATKQVPLKPTNSSPQWRTPMSLTN